LAFETLGPWSKQTIDFINVIGELLIAESGDSKSKKLLFERVSFCYSTWKRCKHSGHFSRFRIIIGNFCILKQNCYVQWPAKKASHHLNVSVIKALITHLDFDVTEK
jgi:hypothetical protein